MSSQLPNQKLSSLALSSQLPLISLLISLYHPLAKNLSNIASQTTTPVLFLCSFSCSSYLDSSILLPISSNYISLFTSLTKSFPLESNTTHHYNFSSCYNLISLLSLTSISLILSCILQITNTTSHKTSISFTISILLKRYQTLILKALLMEGINF